MLDEGPIFLAAISLRCVIPSAAEGPRIFLDAKLVEITESAKLRMPNTET
jgi:hypothetical protein